MARHAAPTLPSPRVVVFDLDGTLYSFATQREVFRRYGEYLREEMPPPSRAAFDEELRRIEEGTSIFRIGYACDLHARAVIEIDRAGLPLSGVDAAGAVDLAALALDPAMPFRLQEGRHVFIGDDWWPRYVAALVHGIDREASRRAFRRARQHLLAEPEEFGVGPNPALARGLGRLRAAGVRLALVTNAQDAEARALLDCLGATGYFDLVRTEANKPFRAPEALTAAVGDRPIPARAVYAVGDNVAFDLVPAHQLGHSTILIGGACPAWSAAVDLNAPTIDVALELLMGLLGTAGGG